MRQYPIHSYEKKNSCYSSHRFRLSFPQRLRDEADLLSEVGLHCVLQVKAAGGNAATQPGSSRVPEKTLSFTGGRFFVSS